MSREDAIKRARVHFDSGDFRDVLARRVAIRTESQEPASGGDLDRYIAEEIRPELETLGFSCRIARHERAQGPFLIAERIEDGSLPTVLGYGHGDVTRGQGERWQDGLSPWVLIERDGRWYGRGVADNKGQHTVNVAALRAVFEARGRLGFNAKYLIEMGEEIGSPGLRELCAAERDALRADLLIASDGPRLSAGRPTLFLGSRGGISFDLKIKARDGAHHSGNWGGLLSNPAVQLAHAIAALVGPEGRILVPELKPADLPASVREALADCPVVDTRDGPRIDPDWGEPGLSAAEKVFGWCALEVLAFEAGEPRAPVNAIPGHAFARLQLRFVVGVDPDGVVPAVRRHLENTGFGFVDVSAADEEMFRATRLDPADPWVGFAARSIERTTGQRPAVLPNLGGSLPNDAFADILGLRTIWVPHSYAGCSQHAPDEHLAPHLLREGLEMMAGLYWDIGSGGTPALTRD
ncbi:M20 family metallopeptidase [Mesorhizobium sp. YIM 152430]|uniref:M20 family metallopeptidase n=1 Tax=Mesorhizobium sp. YIM 152430 TaxID=3031761 RepID=UPI0023DA38F8|nr:M20 family metallopeptidase [Mesorhizobium sp. YIM 152430]MDF1600995.1 M20 family metallopeptidase [Mesorhizobium sp. YIM 152430]